MATKTTEITIPKGCPFSPEEWERLESDPAARLDGIETDMMNAANALMRLAWRLRLMVEKGDPIPKHIPDRFVNFMCRVAAGRALPDLFMKFNGTPGLLHRIAEYPVEHQKAIINNAPIKVIVPADTGGYTDRQIRFEDMAPDQQKMVLGPEGIWDENAQLAHLDWIKTRENLQKADKNRPIVEVDRKRKMLIVHEATAIKRADLARFLAQLED